METETLNAVLGIIGTFATGIVTYLGISIKMRREKTRDEARQKAREQELIATTQQAAQSLINDAFDELNKEREFNKQQFLLAQKDRDEQREKNELANARISELIVSKGDMKDTLDKTTTELQQTRTDLAEAKEEITRLIKRLEKYVEHGSRRDTELEKLQAEVLKLRPLREEVADLRAQLKSMNDQLKMANAEQHSLVSLRERDQQEFERQRDEWRARISELAERVRLLESENKTLKAENSQLKEEVEMLKAAKDKSALPAGTLMFEDVKNASGETVIKAEIIPASGEHETDSLADKEKPK
jgi:chromosome segregation ATPase